ncbi:enoyl-[acyl-carrier-protein] reductase (NADH) [Flavobacteriaceae bacterium UJ101]|nr:enoyl-[acyl-carrier-protein] reductase (NADH) [Flavobacteriaceae bacterium UJ101]
MKSNRITTLFSIEYPIIQGGMIWASGWELVSAVSNAGGLGLIGAGSMYPEILRDHIKKTQAATQKPFGVNVPLMYPNVEEIMKIIIEEGVKIVFTSAGNPKVWTSFLQEKGIKVVHVVSSLKFALKAQEAGVDAIVGEGFEAGGHNGKEETTTMCLIPLLKKNLQIPILAAGGIGSGEALLAAQVLGADGVQIGSRFLMSHEASCHVNFKEQMKKADEQSTMLTLKEIVPVRLMKNNFYKEVEAAYVKKVTVDQLKELKGVGRPKRGMFEGDIDQGMLEVGQVCAQFEKIQSVQEIIKELMQEYKEARESILTNY